MAGYLRLCRVGVRLPTEFYRHVVYNLSVSHDLAPAPNTWTVGLELSGADGAVGVTPQIMKGLTRTGSISAALGVRVPITAPYPLSKDLIRWTGYLLWQYRQPLRARQ